MGLQSGPPRRLFDGHVGLTGLSTDHPGCCRMVCLSLVCGVLLGMLPAAALTQSGITSKKFLGSTAMLKDPLRPTSMLSHTFMAHDGEESVRLTSLAKGLSTLQMLSQAGRPTPWDLRKYDIPMNHRSGVKVDLGRRMKFKGTDYRLPNGNCPVWGKSIKLMQPTTNKKKWPNDYLKPIPLKGEIGDTTPLGGGLAFPTKLFSEHDAGYWEKEYRKLHFPDVEERYRVLLEKASVPLDWCLIANFEQNSPNEGGKTYHDWKYPVAFDSVGNKCYPLYIPMQELRPDICSEGDKRPFRSWYCLRPVKDPQKADMVYFSGYVRPEWKDKCPMYPIKDSQFGQWTGFECVPLAPAGVFKVKTADECGIEVFNHSPSDHPRKPYKPASWDDPVGAIKDAVDGATKGDSPHTSGIGINYGTFFPDGTCYLHTATPSCMMPLVGGFAFTSVGTFQSSKAIGPPCPSDGTGYRGFCDCKTKKRKVSGCQTDRWVNDEVDCECTHDDPGYDEVPAEPEPERSGINPWLIAGPFIGVAVLALCGGLGYYFARRRPRDPKHSMAEASGMVEATEGGKKKRDVSDLMQEADPSFWGEGRRESDETQVMIDTDY